MPGPDLVRKGAWTCAGQWNLTFPNISGWIMRGFASGKRLLKLTAYEGDNIIKSEGIKLHLLRDLFITAQKWRSKLTISVSGRLEKLCQQSITISDIARRKLEVSVRLPVFPSAKLYFYAISLANNYIIYIFVNVIRTGRILSVEMLAGHYQLYSDI